MSTIDIERMEKISKDEFFQKLNIMLDKMYALFPENQDSMNLQQSIVKMKEAIYWYHEFLLYKEYQLTHKG